ncbi:MAG TPA: Stf0 family sulfotransferase [Gaiellaceae bacterium]|nr:Stf0 family sulfotransferase [Gaiellaceae bacterium]
MTSYADWVLQPTLPDRSAPATASCVVCGTQRSGTWLLCGLLASTGAAGRPHEWFSPVTARPARDQWQVDTEDDYLEAVLRAGTTDNGIFGVKVMWNDVGRLEQALPRLPDPHYVWLRRDDVVAQAVSWALAGQSGLYHEWDGAGPQREPPFDRKEVDGFVQLVKAHTAGWAEWFRNRGIEPLLLRYEDLLARPTDETERVLAFLGVETQGPIAVQTRASANGHAEDWIRRYRETAQA